MGLKCVKRVNEKIYIYSGVVAPTYVPQTSRKSALRKGFRRGTLFWYVPLNPQPHVGRCSSGRLVSPLAERCDPEGWGGDFG